MKTNKKCCHLTMHVPDPRENGVLVDSFLQNVKSNFGESNSKKVKNWHHKKFCHSEIPVPDLNASGVVDLVFSTFRKMSSVNGDYLVLTWMPKKKIVVLPSSKISEYLVNLSKSFFLSFFLFLFLEAPKSTKFGCIFYLFPNFQSDKNWVFFWLEAFKFYFLGLVGYWG